MLFSSPPLVDSEVESRNPRKRRIPRNSVINVDSCPVIIIRPSINP
jgi:hypothetical protein